jgi:hypothetical protein
MDIDYREYTGLNILNRIKLQVLKCIKHLEEEQYNEKRFSKYLLDGKKYLLEGDNDLSQEQIEQIKSFWKRYEFAYPKINIDEFKAYTNRTGIFSPNFIPAGIRTVYIAPFLQNKKAEIKNDNGFFK